MSMFGILPIRDSIIFEGQNLFQKALEQPNLYGFLLELPMLDESFFVNTSKISGLDVNKVDENVSIEPNDEDVEMKSVKDDDEKMEIQEQNEDNVKTQKKNEAITFHTQKTNVKTENFVKLTQEQNEQISNILRDLNTLNAPNELIQTIENNLRANPNTINSLNKIIVELKNNKSKLQQLNKVNATNQENLNQIKQLIQQNTFFDNLVKTQQSKIKDKDLEVSNLRKQLTRFKEIT